MKYRLLALAMIAKVSVVYAQADSIPETDSLTLAQAVSATLEHNPQLAGYQFRAQKLDAELETATLKPAYRIFTELENVAGSGDYQGVDGTELTLALSSVIEPAGQRDARMGVVTARQQQLLSEQRVATLEVLTELARTFIALAAAQELHVLRQKDRELAQDAVASLQRQVELGRTPEADLLRAEAALAQAEIEVLHAGHRVKSQRIRLSQFWADATPDFQRVNADLYALPPVENLADLQKQVENNPDAAFMSQTIAVRAAEMRQAQAEGKTGLEWSAGIRRLEATDDAALVLGMSVPLGSAQRSNSRVAEAQAKQLLAEHQRGTSLKQTAAELASLHETYQETLHEADFLQKQVITRLEKAQAATRAAFDRGRYGYLELKAAQADLLKAREQLIEVATQAHLLRIDIERLTGAALVASTVQPTTFTSGRELK